MVIAMVAPPLDPDLVAADFDQLRTAIEPLGVPVVDLRDTFRNVSNLDDLQVIPKEDIHPNIRGHEMMAENLYAKLRANPEAWAALTGVAPAGIH